MTRMLLILLAVSAGALDSSDHRSNQRCGFHCRAALRAERQPVHSVDEHTASVLEVAASVSSRATSSRVGEGGEELVEWNPERDGGDFVRGSVSNEDLLALGSDITDEKFGETLHSLADHQKSRFVGSEGNKKAADFIQKALGENGLETSQQSIKNRNGVEQYLRGIKPGGNVLALLKGSDPELAHEVVVLASHYDSVNWKDTSGDAPGVDDNGSGTALVMLAAQTLAKSHIKPKRSILFATFNGEEEGLVGSADFVSQLKTSDSFLETDTSAGKNTIANVKKENIKAALIVDEVAWPGRGATKNGAIFETRGPAGDTAALVNTLAHTAKLKDDGDGINNFVVNWKGFGSDHISFLNDHIPAVLLIERDDEYHADKWGHSADDTFDHVDFKYGAAMTRLAVRTAMRLASPE